MTGSGERTATCPTIVCLCGSTRFGQAFRAANLSETLAGRIVLSIGCEWHSDQSLGLTEADKERLDESHLRKIDLADEVLALNVGGYVGKSTARELAYAAAQGKVIRYLEYEPGSMHPRLDKESGTRIFLAGVTRAAGITDTWKGATDDR